jgi:hypothetical protein
MTRHCIKYFGPAAVVTALVRMLREEGVDIADSSTGEVGNAKGFLHVISHSIVCLASCDAIDAGLARFSASRFGQLAIVEVNEDSLTSH